jgi:hypothetical protein
VSDFSDFLNLTAVNVQKNNLKGLGLGLGLRKGLGGIGLFYKN